MLSTHANISSTGNMRIILFLQTMGMFVTSACCKDATNKYRGSGCIFGQTCPPRKADLLSLENVRVSLEHLEDTLISAVASILQREARSDQAHINSIVGTCKKKSDAKIVGTGILKSVRNSIDTSSPVSDPEGLVESKVRSWFAENFSNVGEMQDELLFLLKVSLERISLGTQVAEAKFSLDHHVFVDAKKNGGKTGLLDALTDLEVENRVLGRVRDKARQRQQDDAGSDRLASLCSDFYATILIPSTKCLQVEVLLLRVSAIDAHKTS